MKTSLTAFLFLAAILTSAFGEAILTLKSGEVLQGDILSDTNGLVQIRAYSKNRTISSRRDISRSDIQSLQNETPAQAAEREAYFALSKFQLNPDQEQIPGFYTQWIAAFEKFSTDYPKSDKATVIQQRIAACKAELKHVENGEAKFEDQWMSPETKAPLAMQKNIQSLKSKLANLKTQRQRGTVHLGSLQGSLSGAQQSLATAMSQPPRQEPVYRTVPERGHMQYQPNRNPANIWVVDRPAHTEIDGYKTVPPDTAGAQSSVSHYQQQVGKAQGDLASLDDQINDVQSQLSRLEREHEIASAKPNPPKQVVAEAPVVQAPPPPPQPTVQSPPPPPKTEPPLPWYKRLWNRL